MNSIVKVYENLPLLDISELNACLDLLHSYDGQSIYRSWKVAEFVEFTDVVTGARSKANCGIAIKRLPHKVLSLIWCEQVMSMGLPFSFKG